MPPESVVTVLAALRDIAMAVTAGSLVAVMTLTVPGSKASTRAAALARYASIGWAVLAVAYLLVEASVITLVPLTDAAYGATLGQFITQIAIGQAFLQMAIAAVVASMVSALVRTPVQAAWAMVPVAWSIGWQAETGHAAGAADHHLAVSALALHMVGASLWLGVVVAVAWLGPVLDSDAAAVARRMSRVAAWAASAVVVSGVINAALRMTGPSDLWSTTYGRVLLVKVAAMGVAMGLAVWHRRTTLPRLAERPSRRLFTRVMVVDAAVLIFVTGLAAVLSNSAPPVPNTAVPDPSPAFLLTGYELPPAPTVATWFLDYRLEILSAFVLVAMAFLYLRWTTRLRRRGDGWPWYRDVSWLVGIATMLWITQGGPAIYGMVTFSGHMVQHMMLVMVAPIPLTFAAPVTLALRALPPRTDGSRGPREWIRGLVESRWVRFFANPVVAAVNFAGSLVVFYYSPIFHFALANHAGHLWMVLHFTLAGYFFANALIGIDPGPTRPRYPMRLVLLFATMAFHAFFGVSLASSEVLLVPDWFGLMGRPWGPDAITDQQWGGEIAWGIGELPVLALAIGVAVAWRRSDDRESRRQDRQAERDDDAELRRYNAMLGRIAESDRDD
ncbi:cytochrome c oxidase assembly protein [Demequina capsici]|uniref:Cytochrome c oxidase assembly protein n=1 Tax=Demequina capsici TaxID=3075620 RepID=A0AA96JCQ3_9MICO|nr:cytochrome c oxidase assembly protein [Demequina sp. PMTSA13]WNM27166.1 cytochrome c oxidase assembly protein [Demequina sp. PMTSA13]